MSEIKWDAIHILRHGTSSEWELNNIILKEGEMGIETDTNFIKIGNGSNSWNDLKYVNKLDFKFVFNHLTSNNSKIMTIPKGRTLKNIVIEFNEAFDSDVNIGICNNNGSIYLVNSSDTTPQEISINDIKLNLVNDTDLDIYFSITGNATKGDGVVIIYLS